MTITETLRSCAAVLGNVPVRVSDVPRTAPMLTSVLNALNELIPKVEALEKAQREQDEKAEV